MKRDEFSNTICLACKKPLTKYRRKLEDTEMLGDEIMLCENRDCYKAIKRKLKGWKKV